MKSINYIYHDIWNFFRIFEDGINSSSRNIAIALLLNSNKTHHTSLKNYPLQDYHLDSKEKLQKVLLSNLFFVYCKARTI